MVIIKVDYYQDKMKYFFVRLNSFWAVQEVNLNSLKYLFMNEGKINFVFFSLVAKTSIISSKDLLIYLTYT
jgi:hypothetical protein